jgi:hypothetical protein
LPTGTRSRAVPAATSCVTVETSRSPITLSVTLPADPKVPPGGLAGKLNNFNRGGRACRALVQRDQHGREEAAGMTWAKLSEDLATWTIPATRTKNGMPHRRKLALLTKDADGVLGGDGE